MENNTQPTPFEAIKLPREYRWNINSVNFKIVVPCYDDTGMTPREILVHDLEYICDFLRSLKEDGYILPNGSTMKIKKDKPFSLPPLNPESNEPI